MSRRCCRRRAWFSCCAEPTLAFIAVYRGARGCRLDLAEYLAQLFAFGLVASEDAGEPALAFLAQTQVRDAGVLARPLAHEQTCLFGAFDELGHSALRELKALLEFGDGRPLAAVRRAFDHQEQQVASRGQPVRLRDLTQKATSRRGLNYKFCRLFRQHKQLGIKPDIEVVGLSPLSLLTTVARCAQPQHVMDVSLIWAKAPRLTHEIAAARPRSC